MRGKHKCFGLKLTAMGTTAGAVYANAEIAEKRLWYSY
ncbi:exported hypothetical protein [Syntrophobacter sp. SbD1]|nr:exported hypothetical protein [Syntrophobacter sp. SbD1]